MKIVEDKTMWQIALIQIDIALGEPDRNREVLESKIQQAAEAALKPDIIVLPEMWNTGYALEQIDELADPEGLASRRWISESARKFKVHIVAGSVAEKREDKVYNTMLVFDRTGAEVAAYSKIHLFGLMNEDKYLAAGDQAVTFELDGIRAGASICYDIRFPELARTLSLNGAQIMFVPAQWPHPRLQHWRTLLTARAIENQMYVIACNTTGRNGDDHFFGHSAIIDPWGEWIAEGGETEGIITGQLDLTLVHQVRERIPVFKDRRPLAYEL
ncbi:carbon-nitrogen family hydrolase [Paenibacillus motobuensis]|uniref:carbon-nitrogen family hydrolase n=1 Tax=Paenibacillus TaxID=44249 RepID=UPI00203CBF74|nr:MULTISPECIES: carbon-nitrogen family hydrolase [Paenibacillus]MCM3040076.1 carbon-nitrogen family hydrolase [Paenibacillus lutimineralis]MCM3647180.1 carbon-nitrogen family hydrolase [Paenibacillus motobuensis]